MLMVAMLLLTACGKAETKEDAKKEAVEKEKDKNETDETVEEEEAEVSLEDIENVMDEEQTDAVPASDGDNDKNNATKPNSTTPENSSDTKAPATEPSTKPSPEPSTKPSTDNTTAQKPSGGSNVPSTDSQLKAEADVAASKYMNHYQEVLRLVNEIRAEAGVAPLTLNTTMCQAAGMRALEMDYNSKLSHTRPNGSSCFSVLDFCGVSYSLAGENIAQGYNSPAAVVNGWRNSEGHYKNMISPDYTQLGVGYSNLKSQGNTSYWVQLFTK